MNKYDDLVFNSNMESLCWSLGNAVTALQLWKETVAGDFGAVGYSEELALAASETLQSTFLPSLEVIYESFRYIDAGIRAELYREDLE